MKEMKEKEVVMDGSHVTMLFHLLNMLAAKGASEDIRKLQDTIFTLGLTKPSANMCSPLVTSYLERYTLFIHTSRLWPCVFTMATFN